MEKRTVLVTGIGGNVGQGILRNIHSCYDSINIIGVDIAGFTPGNYLCNKTYIVPFAFDEKYISTIQDIVILEKVDLIIPSTDYEIFYLSKSREKLGCAVAASEASVAKIYLDKYETYLHHIKNNIPFAKTWLPSQYDNSCKEIIAKPREGRGSRGIMINPKNLKELSDEYLIQPLIKGIELTTAVYVTKENKLHGIFTMERELTNGTTSKSKVVFDYNQELLSIAQKMINANGLKGSFNIQSMVCENTKEIVPFEINCRISGTNSIRHNLGFQDVKYTLQEYLFNAVPDNPNPIDGVATRIMLDVIYQHAESEFDTINSKINPILY